MRFGVKFPKKEETVEPSLMMQSRMKSGIYKGADNRKNAINRLVVGEEYV